MFVSLIVYIFWFSVIIFVWILRKCEKHDKNGLSRAFSKTQPNTRKYFPKYFLEFNQTLENVFISEKYFPLHSFYSRNSIYIEPNAALVPSLLINPFYVIAKKATHMRTNLCWFNPALLWTLVFVLPVFGIKKINLVWWTKYILYSTNWFYPSTFPSTK